MINAGLKLICKLGLVLHSQDSRFSEFFIEFIHHLLSSVMSRRNDGTSRSAQKLFFLNTFLVGPKLNRKTKINKVKQTHLSMYTF